MTAEAEIHIGTRYYGVYRATVVDNEDPAKRKRLRLRIPMVLDTAVTDWADPCLPPTENHANHKPHVVTVSSVAVGDHGSHSHTVTDTNDGWEHNHETVGSTGPDPVSGTPQHTRHKHVPAVGTQVWVMFEGGNQDYPVWIGVTS